MRFWGTVVAFWAIVMGFAGRRSRARLVSGLAAAGMAKDDMMTQGPGGRVFICYRREDAGYPAGWLFDQLTARLGADRVFKDVDSIEPGDDFADVITEAGQLVRGAAGGDRPPVARGRRAGRTPAG